MSKREGLMWANTAWRFNHRNGLSEESFHGLDRDIELYYMYCRIEWEAEAEADRKANAN